MAGLGSKRWEGAVSADLGGAQGEPCCSGGWGLGTGETEAVPPRRVVCVVIHERPVCGTSLPATLTATGWPERSP